MNTSFPAKVRADLIVSHEKTCIFLFQSVPLVLVSSGEASFGKKKDFIHLCAPKVDENLRQFLTGRYQSNLIKPHPQCPWRNRLFINYKGFLFS